MAHRLTACVVDGCPGKNWTTGEREACPDCVAREERIKKLAARLLKGSHPALGRLRECRVATDR
jgi:hypothetical protein